MLPLHAPKTLLVLTAILVLCLPAGCAKKRNGLTNPRLGPTANFSAAPRSGDDPMDVDFTDLSIPGSSEITSIQWDFGDLGRSTQRNARHLYSAPGIYTVSLTVTTADGSDTATKTDYITVLNAGLTPPNAAFRATPTAGPPGTAIQFSDLSTSGTSLISSWSWNFGDSGTSTLQNPSHTYAADGSYPVSLSVVTAVGTDTETKPGYIVITTVPAPPTAQFSANPTAGNAPLSVQFTDLSAIGTAPITSWSWNFGDAGTSTLQNPSHVYTTPGTYTVSLTATNSVGSDGETKTSFIAVTQGPIPPTAQFSGTPTSGVAPLSVQFTDLSTAGTFPITARLWNFGDGSTSAAQNPRHTYTGAGSYTVTLGVGTAAGEDTENKGDYIQVSPAPVAPTAAFTADQTAGYAPLSVQFTDLSATGGAPITSWAWTFGDGGISTLQNPSHVYTTPGNYTVSLTATNSVGSDGETKPSFIAVAVVPVLPTAQFSGTPTSGVAPLSVQFTDQSTAGTSPITGRLWDFGDGGTSAAQNPIHTYTSAGSYTVILLVATAAGEDTENKSSYIQVSVAPVAPTAAFTADQTAGYAPLSVQFTDLSATGGAPITSWAWTFGDGGTSTLQNPGHIYTTPGNYTVSLTATNSVGSDGETKPGFIAVAVVPVLPTAQFSGTPTSGVAPLSVQFTDLSTAGTSPITAWHWDFGDGGTSVAQNPIHTYTSAGSYTVILLVATAAGEDTENKSSYIQVSPTPVAPTAAFTADQTAGYAPLSVQFTDLSAIGTAPITSWAWNFGDGGTSTLQSPSHTYAVPGNYTVSLTVTSSAGSDGETKPSFITVAVVPVLPTAQFSGTPTTGSPPLSVQFTDQSTAGSSPITARHWDFGDGGTSVAQHPSHTYTSAGSYTVILLVATAAGEDTENKASYVQVCAPPTADFTGGPTLGIAPLTVLFADLSTPELDISSWSWNFGDGGTSTERNPAHVYANRGTYSVSLTVRSSCTANTAVKAAFVTATDACPNAVYSIADARWDTITDVDLDGYRTRGRLIWNADVSDTCPKSVFARVSYRAPGATVWTLAGQSTCYTITGTRTTDTSSMFISGLPRACYDFQIELFECSGTTVKAVGGPADDPALTNQCFEP